MEFLNWIHTNLGLVAKALKIMLELVSVLCVVMGLATSLVMAAGFFRRSRGSPADLPAIRLHFGSWLAVALEFQLGADIVATIINPTLQSLGELALLAAIRTFLNYFLQKELEAGVHLAASIPETAGSAVRPEVEKP